MKNAFASLVVACSLLAACSDPAPPPGAPLEVKAIAGHWRAEGVQLDISDDGTVHYKKERGTSTNLSGIKLSNLTSTGFDIAVGPLNTHFIINAVPATNNGVTTMTVDGIVLTQRTAEEVAAAAKAAGGGGEEVAATTPAPAPASLPAAGTLESIAGLWEGGDMRLFIEQNGTLHYRRGGTKIDGAKVSNVTATSFEAGILGINTTFKIDAAPKIEAGKVVMTVDGVALTKMQ